MHVPARCGTRHLSRVNAEGLFSTIWRIFDDLASGSDSGTLITAIRLRGEPIRPSPKLTATVAESVALARTVLRELQRA